MADLGLKAHYYDISLPGSYSGAEKFYTSQKKATRKQVKRFLEGEEAYTLHHPVRHHFPRLRVVVSSIGQQHDADLIDLVRYRKENKGFSFILIVTDVLSHFAAAEALKTKTGTEVVSAFRRIYKQITPPTYLRTDRGKEFSALIVQRFFNQKHITHFYTFSETKANIVERLIKSIRLRMTRYFTKHKTRNWIDILPHLIDSYNHTVHRSTKLRPAEVNYDNQYLAWRNQYEGTAYVTKDRDFKFQEGNFCRISFLKTAFQREYSERYTTEVFKISSRKKRSGLNIYNLESLSNEEIEGIFYEPELEKVSIDSTGVYRIQKILKTRRRGGKKLFLVRWEGYPPSEDSWITEEDFAPLPS